MKMPFGKFHGVDLRDLPDDYLIWLRGIELRDPLRTAVEWEYERRHTQQVGSSGESMLSDVKLMAEELLTAGYRKLAQRHHPDHGGETRAMILVNLAMEELRKRL